MLVVCQEQFVEIILQGVKTSTIRANRKDGYVAKPGETLYFYAGRRFSPSYRKIGEAVVTEVMPIRMIQHIKDRHRIFIGRKGYRSWMSMKQMKHLASIEGFTSVETMLAFFDIARKGDFHGHQYLFRMKTEQDYPQLELPMEARA